MKRFYYLLTCVLMVTVSCSREKEITEGIRLYNEGLTQTAFVKFKEGLINYSTVKVVSAQNLYFTPHAVFSSENLLSVIYPLTHSFNFPREVVSVWYNPDENVCAVTDGLVVYLSISNKEFIINNPSQEPVKAVAHDGKTYFLCGKELYVYTSKDEQVKKFSTIEFYPPEAFKYYNAYINIVDNKLIVIVGIAGVYNLWVINTGGEVLLSQVRVATWKHFLNNDVLFIIKGSAGNWDLRSIDNKTKQEKTIKTFNSITDIHMVRHGIVINTGETMYVYYYTGEIYTFPFAYIVKGETRDNIVVEYGEQLILSSEKFFSKARQIAQETGCCSVTK